MPPSDLKDYISKARERGIDDATIRTNLTSAGWPDADVNSALLGDVPIPVPPHHGGHHQGAHPSLPHNGFAQHNSQQPIAVVQNLSVRGFEYSIMFITLLLSAFSVGSLLHALVDSMFSGNETYAYSDSSGGFQTFAITLLIVSFPIFAYMFIRLKKAELRDPSIRRDPSRRKWTQFTQLACFIVGLIYAVTFIYFIIEGDDETSLVKQLLHTVITLAIVGGIFAYYWREDHRAERS